VLRFHHPRLCWLTELRRASDVRVCVCVSLAGCVPPPRAPSRSGTSSERCAVPCCAVLCSALLRRAVLVFTCVLLCALYRVVFCVPLAYCAGQAVLRLVQAHCQQTSSQMLRIRFPTACTRFAQAPVTLTRCLLRCAALRCAGPRAWSMSCAQSCLSAARRHRCLTACAWPGLPMGPHCTLVSKGGVSTLEWVVHCRCRGPVLPACASLLVCAVCLCLVLVVRMAAAEGRRCWRGASLNLNACPFRTAAAACFMPCKPASLAAVVLEFGRALQCAEKHLFHKLAPPIAAPTSTLQATPMASSVCGRWAAPCERAACVVSSHDCSSPARFVPGNGRSALKRAARLSAPPAAAAVA
jgi:hypothetical protein